MDNNNLAKTKQIQYLLDTLREHLHAAEFAAEERDIQITHLNELHEREQK